MSDRSPLRRDPLAWGLGILVLLAAAALVWGRSEVVFQADSPFGTVQVEERRDGLRELYLGAGRGRQTALDPSRPTELELPYTRVMLAGLATLPDTGRVLFVGLGGGALPTWTRGALPAAHVDVVEINPVVVEVAGDWFGFRPDSLLAVHLADGRAFMEAAPGNAWDLVVLDAFSDTDIPRALTTRAFLAEVNRVLRPGGLVAANLHTSAAAYRDMLATYGQVFAEVVLLPVPGRRQVVLLAAVRDGNLDSERLVRAARELAAVAPAAEGLAQLIGNRLYRPDSRAGSVLEDRRSR